MILVLGELCFKLENEQLKYVNYNNITGKYSN